MAAFILATRSSKSDDCRDCDSCSMERVYHIVRLYALGRGRVRVYESMCRMAFPEIDLRKLKEFV